MSVLLWPTELQALIPIYTYFPSWGNGGNFLFVRPSALLIFTVGLRSAAATNIQFYSDFVVWVLKADPIKLSNTLQPNACQYVRIGAVFQNNGANQFHNVWRHHASKKLNAIINTISKKHPNLLIFINLSLYKQKMLSF